MNIAFSKYPSRIVTKALCGGTRLTIMVSMAMSLLFPLLTMATSLPDSALETNVCGGLKEWFLFLAWTSAAGSPSEKNVAAVPEAVAVSLTTVDGRTLRGYKIPASGQSNGTVLFAQGNAMLADQMLKPLSKVAHAGFDVYVYDFRGYGLSNGTARLKAIVSDYHEIAESIKEHASGKVFLYGVSFGGIVLLDVLKSLDGVDRVIIDSVPSTLSNHGCPAEYDPVVNIPDLANKIMLIVGGDDHVVPEKESFELAQKVRANGGDVERRQEFGHPFSDGAATEASRLQLAIDFFLKH